MQISTFQLITLVLNFHLTHETVVFCNKTFVVCIHYNVFATRYTVKVILHQSSLNHYHENSNYILLYACN